MFAMAVCIPPTPLKDDVAGCFDYYADLAEKLDTRQYEHVELPDDSFDTKIIRQPLGVIALITPWNYPLLMAAVRGFCVETMPTRATRCIFCTYQPLAVESGSCTCSRQHLRAQAL